MKTVISMLCALFLAACSSVVVKEPLPAAELTEKERDGLEGIWKLDQAVLYLAFDSNNVPWLATVEWDENEFALEKYRLRFSRRKDALYVSIPQEPGAVDRFIFAELKSDGPTLVAWMPNIDAFEQLVDKGKLKGAVKMEKHSKEIVLETPSADILELISTNPATINYKDPLVFQRLK
jgi:hypothetical protein